MERYGWKTRKLEGKTKQGSYFWIPDAMIRLNHPIHEISSKCKCSFFESEKELCGLSVPNIRMSIQAKLLLLLIWTSLNFASF
mmetsp:Transcript_30987/g.74548  ORF Transcript_30987/g.74548 Transcript_30987/m.74548 type:complete len:83 (+) Transcript_30987:1479-1727(+)